MKTMTAMFALAMMLLGSATAFADGATEYNRLFGSLEWREEFPRFLYGVFLPAGLEQMMYAQLILAREQTGEADDYDGIVVYVHFPTQKSSDARVFAFVLFEDYRATEQWLDVGYHATGVANGMFERYDGSVDTFTDLVSRLTWRYLPGSPQDATASSTEKGEVK